MDHYSPYNLDWQPLLLHGWTNSRGGVNAIKRPNSMKANDPYYRFLFDVLLMLLSRILNTAGAPLGRLVAAWIWMGRSVKALAKTLQRMLFSFLSWQLRRAKSPFFRFISYYYPVKRWHVTFALVLAAGLTYKALAYVWSCFNHVARRKRALIKDMGAAKTYKEWLELARDMDELRVNDDDHEHASLYAGDLLQEATNEFQHFRDKGNVIGLMHALRTELYRDFANITNSKVHKNRFVMPRPIQDYILAVRSHLRYVCDCQTDELTVADKRRFFCEIRHAFGRTALVLSGGGSLGAFHLGVCRALMDQGVLPRIIAGSSVGSIVAAIVAVHKDDELKHMYDHMESFNLSFFGNTTPLQTLQHLFSKGTLQDISFLVERLRALLGDYTFLECYNRTGRMLNVTVTAFDTREPPRMLNYLTAPDAVIWSAVAASSAFPGLFPAQELLAKNSHGRFMKFASRSYGSKKRLWHDGSLQNDLPFRQLSEVFNVNHFIVSQTNPHLVPLMTVKDFFSGRGAELVETELKHAMIQAQLYAPKWFPMNWTRLFTQPWEGDVTVLLPWSLYCKGIGKAVTNPTSQDLLDADDGGRIATWKRMSAIQTNCAVEMELDACLSRLLIKHGPPPASAGGQRQSRIPSWHILPIHLGAFTPAVSLHAASRSSAAPSDSSPSAHPAEDAAYAISADDAPPPATPAAAAAFAAPPAPAVDTAAPVPAADVTPAASEADAPPPAPAAEDAAPPAPAAEHAPADAQHPPAVQPAMDAAAENAALAAAAMDPNAPLPDIAANRRSKLSMSLKDIDIREFNADMLDTLSILPMQNPSGSEDTAGAPGSSSSRTRTPADWAGSDCTDNSVHVNLWENLIPIMKSGQVMMTQNSVDTFSLDLIAP